MRTDRKWLAWTTNIAQPSYLGRTCKIEHVQGWKGAPLCSILLLAHRNLTSQSMAFPECTSHRPFFPVERRSFSSSNIVIPSVNLQLLFLFTKWWYTSQHEQINLIYKDIVSVSGSPCHPITLLATYPSCAHNIMPSPPHRHPIPSTYYASKPRITFCSSTEKTMSI